ncbi:hypothetical protein O1L60_42590 [Streptomyces diastatochromogenes]|nr:hypothetical protein [Streptomyces diastatochromogenes]
MKAGEYASAGYHRALAAHRTVVPPHRKDPDRAAAVVAVVRQEQARRDLADRVLPDIERDRESETGRARPGEQGQESETPTSPESIRAQQHQAAEAVRVTQ